MNSPPARPESQEARGANRGRRQPNPNRVRIVNPTSGNDLVKLKFAVRWVKEKRAEWVVPCAEIRLVTDRPENLAYAAGVEKLPSTNDGYDSITSSFEWRTGPSAGATVWMTQRSLPH